jgi:hypothetical protein
MTIFPLMQLEKKVNVITKSLKAFCTILAHDHGARGWPMTMGRAPTSATTWVSGADPERRKKTLSANSEILFEARLEM